MKLNINQQSDEQMSHGSPASPQQYSAIKPRRQRRFKVGKKWLPHPELPVRAARSTIIVADAPAYTKIQAVKKYVTEFELNSWTNLCKTTLLPPEPLCQCITRLSAPIIYATVLKI